MQEGPRLTHGMVTRRIRAYGCEVLESVYAPGEEHPYHAHDRAVFVYVVNGDVSVRSAGSERICSPESMRVVPAGEWHRTRYGSRSARCVIIGIDPERAGVVDQSSRILSEPAFHSARSPVTGFGARIHRELVRADAVSSLAIEALILEMLVSSSRMASCKADRRVPAWLNGVHSRVCEDFRTSMTLSDLAADAAVHPVHLSRTFKRVYGSTIAEYVRMLRIDWAKSELVKGTHPISRIAIDAGFTDHSDFTRQFRAATGNTPRGFRRCVT